MPRVLKHLFGILCVLVVLGCSGGGCSGCAGCGVTPLPEGFDPAVRVENGGSARLTDSGLVFLQQNIGVLAKALLGTDSANGVITFDVPESSGSSPVDYTVCDGGPDPNANPPKCVAEVGIGDANLTLTTAAPHHLNVTGTMPLRLQNLPIEATVLFIPISAEATLSGNQSCPGDNSTFAQIPIDVSISIETNKNDQQSFFGYSRIKIEKLEADKGAIEDSLNFCGGFTGDVLNFFKGFVVDFAYDALLGTLAGTLEDQLCRKANADLSPTCPNGTTDVDGICRFGTTADAECASIILGTDGHIDLGGLLASISPGTKGGLDFVFAAGGQSDNGMGLAYGDLNPINGGATLGLYGGAEPEPLSKCVKHADMALPTGVPIPDELLGNTVAGWPAEIAGPHFGLAISERYANYALNGVYNSGLLCLGVSTETVALLNSSTLKLLIPSITTLALQKEPQQVALMVRPGQPPTVTFGNGTSLENDPNLRIKMNEAGFDFYIFSLDRFIRFMTATFDLDVPVNLTVTPDGLTPVLDKIGVSNGKVSNSPLLAEPPDTLVGALQEIIESQIGAQLGSGFSAIDINSQLESLGLTLTIPDTVEGAGSPGLVRLEKGTDGYLGIFGTLGIADAMPIMKAETSASLGKKTVDPDGLRVGTLTRDNAPRVTIHLDSPQDDGAHAVEYSYRVNEGAWRPWKRDRIVDIQDAWFRLQGRHLVEARARVVGQPMTLDATPARLEVVIDAEAPGITVGPLVDGKVAIEVHDVSGTADALVRTRLDGGTWSDWMAAAPAQLVPIDDASEIEVEAKDGQGNIGSKQQALIRGKPNAAAGCDCGVSGDPARGAPGGMAWFFAIALAGALGRYARRASGRARAFARAAAPGIAARATLALAVVAVAGWSGCSCGDDESRNEAASGTGGDYKCEGDCRTLEAGLIGAYTSTAVAGDTVWVAGYLEADWYHDNPWGDLVVGTWDGEKVAWEIVDGVPAEPEVDGALYNKNGFRGGQTEPGEDVGLWTSIAIDDAGNPAVVYYDRTNRQLKFAQRAGDGWDISVVEGVPGSDIGRYAKLAFAGGTAVVAYQLIEPGTAGAVTSKVRVARGGAGSWAHEDAVVDPATPCRKAYCPSGMECVADTGLCVKPLDKASCDPACAGATACIDQGSGPACADVFDDSRIDSYPDAVGGYIALAAASDGSLGLAWYDRIHGNLVVASEAGGKWSSLIVDGQLGDGTDTGDVGIGASLFIDADGSWHLSYVDGYAESLKYVQLSGPTAAGTPEIVDDGLALAGQQFTDGQHLVGDDSRVLVTAGGEIHITYQDATTGQLRHAVGTPSGGAHTWELTAIDQPDRGFAGAFSSLLEVGGQLQLVNWWRLGGETVVGDVAVVAP